LNEGTAQDPISRIAPASGFLEYLNFSSCGKQVIAKLAGQFCPETHSIEKNPVYQLTVKSARAKPKSSESNKQIISLRDNMKGGLMQISNVINSNYQFQSTTFSHRSLIRQVELVSQNEEVEEKQLLLSLPKWAGANQLGVSVMVPECREEKIRIILNKVSQGLYSLSDPVDYHFPAIVRKDQRAIPRGRKRDANGKLLGSDDGKANVLGQFLKNE
jgi:hypothetical protein